MNIYEFVITRRKADIAGILTASAYAIRENTSLFSALEEMGFFFEELSFRLAMFLQVALSLRCGSLSTNDY